MTTATATTPAPSGSAVPRITFKEILDSEWLKIRTVRSTLWTMLSFVGVIVGMSALTAAVTVATYDKLSAHEKATFDPTAQSIAGPSYLGVIAALVLGVIVVTGEYATGMIRTSMTAVPRRTMLFVGKATALVMIVLIASLISMFAAFFLGQAILSSKNLNVGIGDKHVLRAVIGGALYLALASLFAYAIGMLLRHTGGAVTVAIAAIFVLPIISALFPSSWHLAKYTPSGAGMSIMSTVDQGSDSLGPWGGFLLFCCYTAVLLAAALVLFRKRDA